MDQKQALDLLNRRWQQGIKDQQKKQSGRGEDEVLKKREKRRKYYKDWKQREEEKLREIEMKGGNILKSIWDAIPEPRKHAPPSVRKFLEEHKDWIIEGISICRVPVFTIIQKAINVLRKLTRQKANAEYDRLFHLYMVIKLDKSGSKKTIKMERNEVFNIEPSKASDLVAKGGQCIGSKIPENTSISDFVGKAVQKEGEKFWIYDAINNNCQDMILSVLSANGILSEAVKKFVKQDVKELLPSVFGKIAKAITDKAAGFDRLIKGNGRKRKRGGGLRS